MNVWRGVLDLGDPTFCKWFASELLVVTSLFNHLDVDVVAHQPIRYQLGLHSVQYYNICGNDPMLSRVYWERLFAVHGLSERTTVQTSNG